MPSVPRLVPAVLVATAVAAAGGGALAVAAGTGAGAAGRTTLKLTASAQGKLRFDKARLTAHRGAVTIRMSNPRSSGMRHGIAVEGKGVDKDGKIVSAGRVSTVSVTLKPGTYEFYCPVHGHKQAGMKGKLVVR